MAYVVQVRLEGKGLFVNTPFNTVFVKKAHALSGRWSGSEWAFDKRDEARVREALMNVFGQDGLRSETCTARFSFPTGYATGCDAIRLQGREIAKATGRDSGARLGHGVVLLNGRCGSGGSAKNWLTELAPGTEILVRDFPRWVAEKWQREVDEHDFDCTIEIEDEVTDRETLIRERETLMARVAAIDATIGAIGA